jgi:threonine dehydratase
MVTLDDIRAAQSRIAGVAVRTPLLNVPLIEQKDSPHPELWHLFAKPENLQPIGAFKLRGAYNKIAALPEAERRRGVISYSSGNHAQGVAYAARALGTKAVIVMPSNAPVIKRDGTAALGAEIVTVGPGSEERKVRAEELAAHHGYAIVPPFNDDFIIAGQGTMGLEILEDLPDVETVLVPVGGGGMLSGIAAALKLGAQHPVKVIGVEPEFAADAQASFRAGHIIDWSAEQVTRTLADGLRTQSLGDITFAHIQRFVDDIVTVSEEEIREAVRRLSVNPKLAAEPSGAVAVAAFLFHRQELPQTTRNVAILSGGNIDPDVLKEIQNERPMRPRNLQ